MRVIAMHIALPTTASSVALAPFAFSRDTSSSVRDTSTVKNSVTCGAVKALATIAAAVALRTPLIGIRVSRACDTGAAVREFCTSSRVITPPSPVPATSSRFTPRS